MVKQIPINKELINVFNDASMRFEELFGRKPGPNDPIFLSKYTSSPEDVKNETIKIMESAQISPELIYAYEKTGLLLTQYNVKYVSDVDVEAWNEAIEEYFYLIGNPEMPNDLLVALDDFEGEFESCVICLNYVLDVGLEPASTNNTSSGVIDLENYILLCISKSIKTLRSIRVLIDENIGLDCMPLVRHIYENYLRIAYLLGKPHMLENLVDALVGLKIGTFSYEDRQRRKAVRKRDGKVFQVDIGSRKMAEGSPFLNDKELYDNVYSFLSNYTHPSFENIWLILDEEGRIDPLRKEFRNEAIFLSICFSLLVLDQLTNLSIVSESAKSDVKNIVTRISGKADCLLGLMYEGELMPLHFESLLRRIRLLGQPIGARS